MDAGQDGGDWVAEVEDEVRGTRSDLNAAPQSGVNVEIAAMAGPPHSKNAIGQCGVGRV